MDFEEIRYELADSGEQTIDQTDAVWGREALLDEWRAVLGSVKAWARWERGAATSWRGAGARGRPIAGNRAASSRARRYFNCGPFGRDSLCDSLGAMIVRRR
jgi:hypothetical protein